MHGHFAMTLGAVGRALLDPPRVKDRPGRIEGCVHRVICPRPGIISGALEASRAVGAEILRFWIPPERGPQPSPLVLMDQVKRDQHGEITAGCAIVTLALMETDAVEILDRYIFHELFKISKCRLS